MSAARDDAAHHDQQRAEQAGRHTPRPDLERLEHLF
jgi:hypothetical protein